MTDDIDAKKPDLLSYEEEPIHRSLEEKENPYNSKKTSPIHEEYRELSLDEIPPILEYDIIEPREETTTPTTTAIRKKMQKYLERKAERREKRKSKKKIRQEKIKLSSLTRPQRPSTRFYNMANSSNKQTIVLDLSYEEFMNEKGMAKCANQVARCYSLNRRCPNPVQLHLCSFSGKMKDEISKIDGHEKWDVHVHEKSYMSVFHRSQLVYLSSDSRHVLHKLDPNKIYIIGGFVDHNLHKGVSQNKARVEGIASARLPLDSNILLKTSPVLAINHVFEIMMDVSNGATWREAIQKAMPPRKIQEKDAYKQNGILRFHHDRDKREISEGNEPNLTEEVDDKVEEIETKEETSTTS